MKPETRAAKIEQAFNEHQEALARFQLVRTLSDERGNIDSAANVLAWAISETNNTGQALARLRARSLGYTDMRQISGAGTLAHLTREEWLVRLEQETSLGYVTARLQTA